MKAAKSKIVEKIATATVLSYIYLGSPSHFLPPKKSYDVDTKYAHIPELVYNPYYKIQSAEISTHKDSIQNKIEIIHNLMSTMLENIEDLDPRFSKLVDEHFWELV